MTIDQLLRFVATPDEAGGEPENESSTLAGSDNRTEPGWTSSRRSSWESWNRAEVDRAESDHESDRDRTNRAEPTSPLAGITEGLTAPSIAEINATTGGTTKLPYANRKRAGDRRKLLMQAKTVECWSPVPWCDECHGRQYREVIPEDRERPSEFVCVTCYAWRESEF